jgi:hypothetical protein
MIKKTSQGYQVKSESGKNLSKPNLSKSEAHKRLAVVEFFKKMSPAEKAKWQKSHKGKYKE